MTGPGQPPHKPTDQTRAQVAAMVAYGITAVEIGKVIGISDTTLRKYYREEIDTGTAVANAKVAESLYKKALGDGPSAVTAAIFWMKTRAGWKETLRNEHTGEDGAIRLVMTKADEAL